MSKHQRSPSDQQMEEPLLPKHWQHSSRHSSPKSLRSNYQNDEQKILQQNQKLKQHNDNPAKQNINKKHQLNSSFTTHSCRQSISKQTKQKPKSTANAIAHLKLVASAKKGKNQHRKRRRCTHHLTPRGNRTPTKKMIKILRMSRTSGSHCNYPKVVSLTP